MCILWFVKLVIVESPTKAKTLSKYLGKGFDIKASMGHIRDLPKSGLGVDVENNFEPEYVVAEKGKKILRDLSKAAKEAEAHAEDDKKKREAAEAKNIFDNTIYQAEKMTSDHKDKLSDEDKKSIEDAVEAAKKVQADEKSDKDAYETATKTLNEAVMPIGAKMYEQAAEEGSDEESGDVADATASDAKGSKDKKSKAKDEPVEGEVVDDKDKKSKK